MKHVGEPEKPEDCVGLSENCARYSSGVACCFTSVPSTQLAAMKGSTSMVNCTEERNR